MVQCAVEYGSPCEPDHITFGEFSILVTELQNYYSKRWVYGLYEGIRLYQKETEGGTKKQKKKINESGAIAKKYQRGDYKACSI